MVSVLLLTDLIPIHFGPGGSDLGSKYWLITFPVIITVIGTFLFYVGRWVKDDTYNDGRSSAALINRVNIAVLIMFNAILLANIFVSM